MKGAGRFWERLLGGAAAAAVGAPRATLVAALLVAGVAAAAVATRLELRTSNLDLVSPELPEVRRFRDFAASFGTPNLLVVVLEGEDPGALSRAADRVTAAAAAQPGVRHALGRLPFREDLLLPLGGDPYFRSRDGRMAFVFVQPSDAESAAATLAPVVAGVRATIAGLGLAAQGIRFGTTGLPQYALDDRDVVRRDIARWSSIAFAGVLALFVVAFRELREPALAMAVLAWSALVTAGVAALLPGHLTLVSAFFFSILFGLGIDFGVHVVERSEELRAAGAPPAEALVSAVRALAPSLGTGAATTAASFLLLLASGFRGFAELGWLAGVGVLVALLAMVTLLPVLLLTWRGRRRPRGVAERRTGRVLLALQRPWIAWPLVAPALALPWIGLPAFDGDYLRLQPVDSEAVRLERAMTERSGFAAQFAAFVAADAPAAERLVAALRREETVGEVRSLAEFAPLLALEAEIPGEWQRFAAMYRAADGREAVYAFPSGDVWNPEFQRRFLTRLRALDPEVTGMPFLGRFLVERSRRALAITSGLAAAFLVGLVALDLSSPWRALLAVSPAFAGVAVMLAAMRWLGVDFNPLNLLALPIVLGVAEDSGVHLVHRFVAEAGDLGRTLAGAGRTILVCGATTWIGFGALAGASHRGLASLAQALALGVGAALAYSLLVLPQLLRRFARRILAATPG